MALPGCKIFLIKVGAALVSVLFIDFIKESSSRVATWSIHSSSCLYVAQSLRSTPSSYSQYSSLEMYWNSFEFKSSSSRSSSMSLGSNDTEVDLKVILGDINDVDDVCTVESLANGGKVTVVAIIKRQLTHSPRCTTDAVGFDQIKHFSNCNWSRFACHWHTLFRLGGLARQYDHPQNPSTGTHTRVVDILDV